MYLGTLDRLGSPCEMFSFIGLIISLVEGGCSASMVEDAYVRLRDRCLYLTHMFDVNSRNYLPVE